eukprot:scaffold276452_cov36-Tisochrysis_lutea.AAC.2
MLPPKDQRKKKDFFASAETVLEGKKLDEDELAAQRALQDAAGAEWKASHDADAPRRERVLRMKGCLDGQCCYKSPGQMLTGP